VFDCEELEPQGAPAQEAIHTWFRGLAALPFAPGLFIRGSAMTCVQLARWLHECGTGDRIQFTDVRAASK